MDDQDGDAGDDDAAANCSVQRSKDSAGDMHGETVNAPDQSDYGKPKPSFQ